MSSQEKQLKGEMLMYQTEDGAIRIDVRFQDETLWLTQMQLADLFQKDKRTISEHIANLYEEGELTQEATVRNFRTVQKEGSREVERDLASYNLDVAISVGYRVKSIRGTQFRIWATQRLKEYLISTPTEDEYCIRSVSTDSKRARAFSQVDLILHLLDSDNASFSFCMDLCINQFLSETKFSRASCNGCGRILASFVILMALPRVYERYFSLNVLASSRGMAPGFFTSFFNVIEALSASSKICTIHTASPIRL